MANWNGAARSNYVKVKDVDALCKALSPFEVKVYPKADDSSMVCLLSTCPDYGGWPSYIPSEDPDEEIEFSFAELVCPHLVEDQILVVMECGHEKLRYLTGHAEAYDHTGKMTSIDLNDIYAKAAKFFDIREAQISQATY